MADEYGDDAPLYARLRALFAADPLMYARTWCLNSYAALPYFTDARGCSDEIGLVFGIDAADVTVDNAFVLEAHKLGVTFAAGPALFKQATARFCALNPLLGARATPEAQSDGVEIWRSQLLDSTRAILLISADFYTAWNTRKEFVRCGWLDALDELRFCDLVFTLHPKSIDTWAYRRWLAARVVASLQQDDVSSGHEAFDAFYAQQIDVCERLAEQKARNYHAWSYRHWMVSQCAHDDEAHLTRELERMRVWCESHITDHSGWNHRQHVVKLMLHACKATRNSASGVRSLVLAEYELLSKIMALYPTHEALWCHRRFVVQLVLRELLCSDKLEIGALMRALREWDGKVASSAGVSTDESAGEVLATGWRRNGESIATESSESLVLAIVHEMELAWGSGNRFARRFALWCLERLRLVAKASSDSSQASLLIAVLESLGDALRERLRASDSLLEDLWTSQSTHDH